MNQYKAKKLRVFYNTGKNGKKPVYASTEAAGCDLFAAEAVVIRPGETITIGLDLIMALPKNFEAQVRPRSGLSLTTDLRLPNSPGTIDSDYRGELKIIATNSYNPDLQSLKFCLEPEKIADFKEKYRRVTYLKYFELLHGKTKAHELKEDKIIAKDMFSSHLYLDEFNNPLGSIYIEKHQRIAQLIISPIQQVEWVENEDTEIMGCNRGGGFGSTGK